MPPCSRPIAAIVAGRACVCLRAIVSANSASKGLLVTTPSAATSSSSPITVPLLDLKAQYAPIKAEIRAVIDEVCDSQMFVLGKWVGELEAGIAKYVGSKFAIGCASGSDAIMLALMALGIGEAGGMTGGDGTADDEIICPSYTFFATGGYICRAGAKPIFAEIDPVTYNVDPDSVRAVAKKCKRLRGIMPVHLFGQAADMDALLDIGREFGVPVIEDAAQAIGTRDSGGVRVGTRGVIGCFSFFPSKNLGAFGDGGILTTNDADLADRLNQLRVHGMKPKYYHKWVGVNSRLDSLQAAVLNVKLKYLDQWTAGRQRNAAHYDRAFASAGRIDVVFELERRLRLASSRSRTGHRQVLAYLQPVRHPRAG